MVITEGTAVLDGQQHLTGGGCGGAGGSKMDSNMEVECMRFSSESFSKAFLLETQRRS